jgi:virulence-associated protein VagC
LALGIARPAVFASVQVGDVDLALGLLGSALLADIAETGLSITAEGDRLVIRPASKLTDPMRCTLRDAEPEPNCAAHARSALRPFPGPMQTSAASWQGAIGSVPPLFTRRLKGFRRIFSRFDKLDRMERDET